MLRVLTKIPVPSGSSLGLKLSSTPHLIRELRRGLPFHTLEALSSKTEIPLRELAALIGLPSRTFARRKSTGRLAPAESERLLRISRIFEFSVNLFNGRVPEAVAWLRSPNRALAGSAPLEYSSIEVGAREVENLIGQLEHGVFP